MSLICFLSFKQRNPEVPKEHWASDPQASIPTPCSWNRTGFQGNTTCFRVCGFWCGVLYVVLISFFCCLGRRISVSRAMRFSLFRKLLRLTSSVSSRIPTSAPSTRRGWRSCRRISNLPDESEGNELRGLFLVVFWFFCIWPNGVCF